MIRAEHHHYSSYTMRRSHLFAFAVLVVVFVVLDSSFAKKSPEDKKCKDRKNAATGEARTYRSFCHLVLRKMICSFRVFCYL